MMQAIEDLLSNDVFNGVAGGAVVGYVFYLLKGLPVFIKNVALRAFFSKLTIYSEDPAFDKAAEWFSGMAYRQKTRRLQMVTQEEHSDTFCTLGDGMHVLFHAGRPLFVSRNIEKEGGASWRRRETLDILIPGSPKNAHELVKEIVNARSVTRQKLTEVYLYTDGWWRLACRKRKRSVDTVVLPSEQWKRIVEDLETFFARREWYWERGVPYRRSLMFEGPPGCGKTSLVMALAAHFSLPVYVLNLGGLKNDNDLFQATSRVPEQALLLIEDIDAAQKDRVDEIAPPTETKKEEPQRLTLSGLLNCIDGAFTKEGRVMILTTNYPDRLDSAMIRPGRVDLKEHIGVLEAAEASRMCHLFLGEDVVDLKLPMTPAELQKILLELAA